MGKYRDKAKSNLQAQPLPERDAGTRNPAVLLSLGSEYRLGSEYGLGKDMDIGISVAGTGQMSAEQEYQAYISEPLSKPSVDILKFWEVCRTRRTSNI
jgi:hypothetical protein